MGKWENRKREKTGKKKDYRKRRRCHQNHDGGGGSSMGSVSPSEKRQAKARSKQEKLQKDGKKQYEGGEKQGWMALLKFMSFGK